MAKVWSHKTDGRSFSPVKPLNCCNDLAVLMLLCEPLKTGNHVMNRCRHKDRQAHKRHHERVFQSVQYTDSLLVVFEAVRVLHTTEISTDGQPTSLPSSFGDQCAEQNATRKETQYKSSVHKSAAASMACISERARMKEQLVVTKTACAVESTWGGRAASGRVAGSLHGQM